jgi:hypothetical protein
MDIQPKPIPHPHQPPISPIMLYHQTSFPLDEDRVEARPENPIMSVHFAVDWFDTLTMSVQRGAQTVSIGATIISAPSPRR